MSDEKSAIVIFAKKVTAIQLMVDKVQNTLADCPEATPQEATEHSAYALQTAMLLQRLIFDANKHIIGLKVQKNSAYGKAMSLVDSKATATRQKAQASSDTSFLKATAELEIMENNHKYFAGMKEVCHDAHKFYKYQMKV